MHTTDSIAIELGCTRRWIQKESRRLFGRSSERPRVLSDEQRQRVLDAFQKQGRHQATRQQAKKLVRFA